jgi:hypothetical protein
MPSSGSSSHLHIISRRERKSRKRSECKSHESLKLKLSQAVKVTPPICSDAGSKLPTNTRPCLRPLSAAQVANRPHQATTTTHHPDLLRVAEPGPASFTGTQSSPPPPPSDPLRHPPSPTAPSAHLSRQPDRSFCTNPSIPRCIRLVCCTERARSHGHHGARVRRRQPADAQGILGL